MKIYKIHREGEEHQLGKVVVTVHVPARLDSTEYILTPYKSLKVRNHSPTGFEFGYEGSGPAQLALAILMDYTGKIPSPALYQAFKSMFIAPMKHPGGTITAGQIEDFCQEFDRVEKEINHEQT